MRVIQHDAVEVLTHMIAPASLDGMHIFFPDPWHKKRHHKRRLIQPPLVALLAKNSSPAAISIWPPTGRNTPSRCSPCLPPNRSLPTPRRITRRAPDTRPLTKFEQRGIRLGHGVWDLVFRRA